EFGLTELAQLKTETLRKWHAGLAKAAPRLRTAKGEKQNYRKQASDEDGRRARKASANRTLTVLKAALNFAWREGKGPSGSAWRRVEPFEAVEAARVRYLTVPEAKRLLNACVAEFRPMVQAALQTGCRYGELTRLQRQDFNPEAGTLAVRKSKSGKPRH